jgi:predicted dienelactone hydrolase
LEPALALRARRLPQAAEAPAIAPAGEDAGSYRDQRVKAIVALDPALGPGHRAASLAAMTVPVHIVGAVANDFLPFESHAAWYARHIPGASLTPLTGGEGHFVFLNTCDAERDANGVPLCRDRRGVDRSRVHARLAALITDFFGQHLTPA